MSGIDLLNRFLTAYRFSLPLDQVHDDPSLSRLSDLGVIEDRASGTTVLCNACDLQHTVKIGIDPDTDKLGWRCPEAGFVEATSDQLSVVRFLPDALAARIADALQCQRRREAPLIENLLWKLGWYEFQANDVNVYLASRIRDAEDACAIACALHAEPGLRNGLVITPDISATSGLTIAGCRFADLGNVIGIENDGLSCDQSRVAMLAGVAVKQRGGRPYHAGTDQAFAMIRDRHYTGTCASSKRAEVREVSNLLGDKAPKRRRLTEIISEVWAVR